MLGDADEGTDSAAAESPTAGTTAAGPAHQSKEPIPPPHRTSLEQLLLQRSAELVQRAGAASSALARLLQGPSRGGAGSGDGDGRGGDGNGGPGDGAIGKGAGTGLGECWNSIDGLAGSIEAMYGALGNNGGDGDGDGSRGAGLGESGDSGRAGDGSGGDEDEDEG